MLGNKKKRKFLKRRNWSEIFVMSCMGVNLMSKKHLLSLRLCRESPWKISFTLVSYFFSK